MNCVKNALVVIALLLTSLLLGCGGDAEAGEEISVDEDKYEVSEGELIFNKLREHTESTLGYMANAGDVAVRGEPSYYSSGLVEVRPEESRVIFSSSLKDGEFGRTLATAVFDATVHPQGDTYTVRVEGLVCGGDKKIVATAVHAYTPAEQNREFRTEKSDGEHPACEVVASR